MHIPDGFLSTRILAGTGLISVAGLGWALRKVRSAFEQRLAPLLGIVAAFVFAAQMLNFPVLGGTSTHLLGSALAGILMGPAAGMIIISSVLIIQALFGDGGIFALAANIFNMAVLGVLAGYTTYRLVRRIVKGKNGLFVGAVMAGWVSVVLASIACGLEIALSGTAAPSIVIPALGIVHMLTGIGEGLITAFVVVFVLNARPDLVEPAKKIKAALTAREIVVGCGVVLAVAFLLSPLASSLPDGLEHVAQAAGFSGQESPSILSETPFSDYGFPGVISPFFKTALAGLVGSVVVFVLGLVVARLTFRRARENTAPHH